MIRLYALFAMAFLGMATVSAQTTYYSVAAATDFNATTSWGTNADGSGTQPTTISTSDIFIIQNSAMMNLSGPASVRKLTINAGRLTIAANDLVVEIPAQNNTELNVTSGGTLTVSGGSLTVNGACYFADGSSLTQTGGEITVDGNSGTLATSVGGSNAAAVIFGIGYLTNSGTSSISSVVNAAKFVLSGGRITIVDPSMSASTTAYAWGYRGGSGFHVNCGTGHTVRFGDGVSTQAGGHTNGLYCYNFVGTGYLSWGNVEVDMLTGTNRFAKTTSSTGIQGDLTITSGDYQLSSTTYIAGNIVNDGTLTCLGTLRFGNWTSGAASSSNNAQSISGTGVFRNSATASTANFAAVIFDNINITAGITFSNANSLLSGSNTATSSSTLTFTNGRIHTNGGIFWHGTTAHSTLTYSNGGFMTGSSYGRFYVATTVGATITAGADPAVGAGSYPFLTASGTPRRLFLERVTTGAVAGNISVSYTESAGTSVVGIIDGSYTVDMQANDSWTVSTGFSSAPSYELAITAPSIFPATPASTNTRIVQASSVSGTFQTASLTPCGQRGMTSIDGTHYLGINSSEFPALSATSGAWEDPNTWVGMTVPTACTAVEIAAGHTVSVSALDAACGSLTLATTAGLNISGSTLTIGCMNNNNPFTMNGTSTLNVSGGTFKINGTLKAISGQATVIQSGGSIIVDGNNAGDASTSATSHIFDMIVGATTNLQLTGGSIIIVDPVAVTTTSARAFKIFPSVQIVIPTTHTLILGDGASVDAGGNSTTSFGVELNNGTNYVALGNVQVDIAAGTNRFANTGGTFLIGGNLTITQGEYRITSTNYIKGNIVNNGLLTTSSTLRMGDFVAGTATAATTPSSISGIGAYANSTVTVTANFSGFTVHNTGGVTMDANALLSGSNSGTVSGTLTFTAGTINTGANAFILGIATPATGTLTYTAGGFLSGSAFSRWFTTTNTGSVIAAGVDPTSSTMRFPFLNSSALNRSVWLERVAGAAGMVTMTYNETGGVTSVSLPDGAYTVDQLSNDSWTVDMGTVGSTSFKMAIVAPSIFPVAPGNGNTRIIPNGAAVGTHQNGTITPGGQRVFTATGDMNGTFHLGISLNDIPVVSAGSGPWESTSTWVGGLVPGVCQPVTISSGHSISSTGTNGCTGLDIVGSLSVTAGTLTNGCAGNSSVATVSSGGSFSISSGIFQVNGYMRVLTGANFSQTGGEIIIDGNNNGDASTSAGTNNLFSIGISGGNYTTGTINMTGGTLTIVDPPQGTAGYAAVYFGATGNHINLPSTHTIKLGNGASLDPSGWTSGFRLYGLNGSGYMSFGSLTIDALTGTNRFVTIASGTGILGNVDVISGDLRVTTTNYFAGNINVETVAKVTTTSILQLASYMNGVPGATSNIQSISGDGTWVNSLTTATANLVSLLVNNSSGTPIVLPANMISGQGTGSISGTLTLSLGKINVGSTPLILGTSATSLGTLSPTTPTVASYIIGEYQKWTGTAAANFYFPVGTSGTPRFAQVNFTTGQTTGGRISTLFQEGSPGTSGLPLAADAANGGIAIEAVSSSGFWQIDRLVGDGGTYNVTCDASNFQQGPGSPITDFANVKLVKRGSSSPWAAPVAADGTAVTIANAAGMTTAQRTGCTSFSVFAIGGTSAALPIELKSFSARENGLFNTINWASASELNVREHVIERSADGISGWSAIGSVASKGNTTVGFDYFLNDEKPLAISFYRLRSVDFDGASNISNIVAVTRERDQFGISAVFPVPTETSVNVQFETMEEGDVQVQITDLTGRVAKNFTISAEKGVNQTSVSLDELSAGAYFLTIKSGAAISAPARIVKQ